MKGISGTIGTYLHTFPVCPTSILQNHIHCGICFPLYSQKDQKQGATSPDDLLSMNIEHLFPFTHPIHLGLVLIGILLIDHTNLCRSCYIILFCSGVTQMISSSSAPPSACFAHASLLYCVWPESICLFPWY